MDIVYFLQWWLGLGYVGLVAFFLLRPELQKLPGQGFMLAKVLGWLGLTYVAWLLSSVSAIPYSAISIVVIVGLFTLAAGWRFWRTRQDLAFDWRSLLTSEAIFLSLLAAWSLVRSYHPRIEGVEKFMNIAFINSALRTEHFPIIDPWFAGEPINYYYFGHLMMATLIKLTHVPAEIAFNLGVATLFALAAMLVGTLVYALTRWSLAAVLAAFLATLASNLDPALHILRGAKDYVFFSATRLDPYVINEFPLYSFVIADLHAHTMDLPITLGYVTLLYVVYQQSRLSWLWFVLMSLMVGAMAPTNAFDALVYGVLTGLVLGHRQLKISGWQWKTGLVAAGQTMVVGALAVVLYTPFYLNFQQPTGGLGVDLFKTPIEHLLINFGVMLFLLLPVAVVLWPASRQWLLRKKYDLTPADYFVGLLILCGVFYIVWSEFFYVKDIYAFENPPYARANSVFKIYYQIWILFSLAAGYGFYLARQLAWRFRLVDIYVMVGSVLVVLAATGTWTAATSYQANRGQEPVSLSLDGYGYLQQENPQQLALIDWINQHVTGQPTMVEAVGDSYTQLSRVSSYTGLPSPLGWSSHEWGWRYSSEAWGSVISPRIGYVSEIYQTDSSDQLKLLLAKYDIEYIVVSPVEEEKYQKADFPAIEQLAGRPVFQAGQYKLYRVPAS